MLFWSFCAGPFWFIPIGVCMICLGAFLRFRAKNLRP